MDASLTGARLRSVGDRLDSFWAGTEQLVDHWSKADTEWSERLQWTRRRRPTASEGDRASEGDTAPAVFDRVDTAEVLGWLYVREGSTLGGALVEAHASVLLGDTRLISFAPYDEGPQPMWRAYLGALDAWCGADADRAEVVATAALKTFTALEDWLLPVFVATASLSR